MSVPIKNFWQDKAVLITGASSGIGWALTEELAQYGVHFGLLSRRQLRMQRLADSLRGSGSKFWIRSCDVRDREQVLSAVQEFERLAGRIDVAWINSGVSLSSSHDRWHWDSIEVMLDTNLKGAIYTAQACLDIMVKQGSGAIVGVGSAAAMRGLPGRGVYCLTKVALEYFLLSKSIELPQIQFTIIHPGFVDTPINKVNPNRFWLQSPCHAARRMIKAVTRRRRFFVFPRRMAALFLLVRYLPLPLYLWLARKAARRSHPDGSYQSQDV